MRDDKIMLIWFLIVLFAIIGIFGVGVVALLHPPKAQNCCVCKEILP